MQWLPVTLVREREAIQMMMMMMSEEDKGVMKNPLPLQLGGQYRGFLRQGGSDGSTPT